MNKQLLIVGIDPGTTLAYALLDFEGHVIDVDSSKELNLNSLVSLVFSKGSPVIVSTDKQKLPDFVNKFSIKVGARAICPIKDMLVSDKRLLIKEHKVKNSHEADALASAIFSFKQIQPHLLKLNDFIEQNNKKPIEYELKKLVLSQGNISFKTAAQLLEEPLEKEASVIKKAVEEKKYSQDDFLTLHEEHKSLKRANSLLKQQNNNLKNQIEMFSRKSRNQENRHNSDTRILKNITFKEERIFNLTEFIHGKEREISKLKSELANAYEFLSSIGEYAVVKKIRSFGWEEFNATNKFIKVHSGDILLVEEPSTFSYRTLEYLRTLVSLIITKKPVPNIVRDELKADFILSKDITIIDGTYFALVLKKDLEKHQQSKEIFYKVVDEYKRLRA
jgi:predicted RNase H-like nuclease (RuvC/YqgF family)